MAQSEKKFLRALAGEVQEIPPIWLMRQAGRYLPEYRATRAEAGSFLDLCYSPDHAVEVTLQPLRRYDFDAAILFSDILVIPQALGQGLSFVQGEGPQLPPIRSGAGLAGLSTDNLHQTLAPVYETVSRLSEQIPPTTALIGFAGAPWTVATYMVEGRGSKDFAHTRRWAYGDPQGFQELIDLVTGATILYLKRQIAAGAEVIQLFETWAGVLDETGFKRWCIDPMVKITAALKRDYPNLPVIGFPRAAGVRALDYVKATGVQGLGLDSGVPLAWARDYLQSEVCVQGNLDPMLLVSGGRSMRIEIQRILNHLTEGPFIFNLGHGITPETPPEHVAELVKIIRRL